MALGHDLVLVELRLSSILKINTKRIKKLIAGTFNFMDGSRSLFLHGMISYNELLTWKRSSRFGSADDM